MGQGVSKSDITAALDKQRNDFLAKAAESKVLNNDKIETVQKYTDALKSDSVKNKGDIDNLYGKIYAEARESINALQGAAGIKYGLFNGVAPRSESELKYAPISLMDTLGNYYTKEQVDALVHRGE